MTALLLSSRRPPTPPMLLAQTVLPNPWYKQLPRLEGTYSAYVVLSSATLLLPFKTSTESSQTRT